MNFEENHVFVKTSGLYIAQCDMFGFYIAHPAEAPICAPLQRLPASYPIQISRASLLALPMAYSAQTKRAGTQKQKERTPRL